MPKVIGPLGGTSASGSLGKALIYQHGRWGPVVKKYITPVEPNSAKQQAVKNWVQLAVRIWRGLYEFPYETWLEGYGYRNPVIITNPGDSPLEDEEVEIDVQGNNPAGNNYIDFEKTSPDGVDICFTDDDKLSLLSHTIDAWDDSAKTGTITVTVPEIPADGTATIYMYY